MLEMIASLAHNTSRVFPTISADFYNCPDTTTAPSPDQRVAHRLLALGQQNVGPWERLVKRKLDSTGRLGWLLFHHRSALQAELAGQTGRANFFWRELHEKVKDWCREPEFWEQIVTTFGTEPGAVVVCEPAALKQRFLCEVLFDTHCAFYNGQIQAAVAHDLALNDRAFAHVDYINDLLADVELNQAEWQGLIVPPIELRLRLYQQANQWDEAIHAGELLRKYFPADIKYQDQVTELYFARAVKGLSSEMSETKSLRAAGEMQPWLERLEALQRSCPDNLNLYQALGSLHHIHAIQLANGGDLTSALRAAQKAVTFAPKVEESEATRQQLIQSMENLKAHVQALELEIALTPGAYLNAEGQRLQRAAATGFSTMNQYANSAEAEQTTQSLSQAQAQSLWRRIGLAPPTDHADERAVRLLQTLGEFLDAPPATAPEIAPLWYDRASQDELLAELDHVAICAFLRRGLFAEETPAPEPSEPAPERQPHPAPPLLMIAPSPRQQNAEPFGYWLLSGSNLKLKALAATALVVLLLAGVLSVRATWYQRSRENAWRQLIQAKEGHNVAAVLAAAEKFLSHPPLSGLDGRETKVLRYYQEALVQLALEPDSATANTLQTHFARYRQLAPPTHQEVRQP